MWKTTAFQPPPDRNRTHSLVPRQLQRGPCTPSGVPPSLRVHQPRRPHGNLAELLSPLGAPMREAVSPLEVEVGSAPGSRSRAGLGQLSLPAPSFTSSLARGAQQQREGTRPSACTWGAPEFPQAKAKTSRGGAGKGALPLLETSPVRSARATHLEVSRAPLARTKPGRPRETSVHEGFLLDSAAAAAASG